MIVLERGIKLETNNQNYLTKSYTVEEKHIKEIEDVKFKKRFKSDSEVVRKALEIGLKELKK